MELERLSGAEMVIRALADEGVTTIYGYPGGTALHMYDALFQQDRVSHILVRHEQAATHMADGYARVTGKAGVVLVTSGPGATNTITGIATAYLDSIPMVVISGQVVSTRIGTDMFQETDMVGISRPIVKHSFLVRQPSDIPLIIKKAFYIAQTGRPGPVVIDIPKDMTDPNKKFPYSYPESVFIRSYNPAKKGHSRQIRKALQLLLQAHKPVLYTGGGVIISKASHLLVQLAKQLRLPVTNTLMGLGAFPQNDDQFLGMLGMHGSYTANMAMHHSDLIIAIGARFDDRVTNNVEKFCPEAKIIHIDIDPASIGKNIPVDLPIVGPADQVLRDLLQQLSTQTQTPPSLESWWQQIQAWKDSQGKLFPYDETPSPLIKPQAAIEALCAVTQGMDPYVTSDVGQHQMFAAQYFQFNQPNRWINSGGLGTMGFGLPAAMGIKLNFPDATVVCVTGEGSLQMNIQELSTCLQYDLNVKIILLNNQCLGMVRQWQNLQYDGRYSHSYMESLPNFTKLAESYGHVGMEVERMDELHSTLEEAFAMTDRLVLVNIKVDPDEHVYPMQIKDGTMCDLLLCKDKGVS